MVADLLEMGQRPEHDAGLAVLPGAFEVALHGFEDAAVKERLLLRQRAIGVDLALVRQVADDRAVAFEPSQDVGRSEAAQRRTALLLLLLERFDPLLKARQRAEQPRRQEIEDAPEVGQAVFDRRAGERDPPPAAKPPDRPALAGVRILDRLRFIDDDGREFERVQPRAASPSRRS